jgi:hypothetical protein
MGCSLRIWDLMAVFLTELATHWDEAQQLPVQSETRYVNNADKPSGILTDRQSAFNPQDNPSYLAQRAMNPSKRETNPSP